MSRGMNYIVPDMAKCAGCGVCVQVCTQKAITMQPAENGCVYPVIAQDQCIGCGQCVRRCIYHKPAKMNEPRLAYAAVATDSELVKKSASGGMFAALARNWLQAGGMIAGAVMDCQEGVRVYHVLSDQVEDLYRMQGSKYVQSDAWRCYQAVGDALKKGRQVLFSGTPCQVDAIKELTGDPDNLTTIDLICHGVPPVKMLEDYVGVLEKRFHGKVEGLCFRDKSLKKSFSARLDVRYAHKIRRFYLRSHEMSFYKYFLEGANYRENCYSCPYARLERISDLTIGDYWGIQKQHAMDFETGKMPEERDWSCVLVNTEKGSRLLEEHAQDIALYASKPAWIAEENHQLRHPTIAPEGRMDLLSRYEQGGYAKVENDFVQSCGGKVKYHLRLLKRLAENQRAIQSNNHNL